MIKLLPERITVSVVSSSTVACAVHIPPPNSTAASLVPSADEAMEVQPEHSPSRALVCNQLVPELPETQIVPLALPTASLVPSADEAEHLQYSPGALVLIQVTPESVDT